MMIAIAAPNTGTASIATNDTVTLTYDVATSFDYTAMSACTWSGVPNMSTATPIKDMIRI